MSKGVKSTEPRAVMCPGQKRGQATNFANAAKLDQVPVFAVRGYARHVVAILRENCRPARRRRPTGRSAARSITLPSEVIMQPKLTAVTLRPVLPSVR